MLETGLQNSRSWCIKIQQLTSTIEWGKRKNLDWKFKAKNEKSEKILLCKVTKLAEQFLLPMPKSVL